MEHQHTELLERAVGQPSPAAVRPAASNILKVAAHSRPSAVAGAIAGIIREQRSAEVQAIGAGATNQAIKSIAIARSYLHYDGIGIVCVPSFVDIMIDSEERTGIHLLVERR